MTATLVAALVVLAFAGVGVVLLLSRLPVVVAPNEIAIFSGSRRRAGSSVVGYVAVRGGRRLRLPLVETVDILDASMLSVPLEVSAACTRGCIPMTVSGVASVKLATDEPVLGNAVERFLGRSREEVHSVARDVLGATLREVLAGLPPEQVAHDLPELARRLTEHAEDDLRRIGLILDTVKIQSVKDDLGYLDVVGKSRGQPSVAAVPTDTAPPIAPPSPAEPVATPPDQGSAPPWQADDPPWKK